VNQIENPNPRLGANNWYTRSGYPSGSYTNCSDESEPGVAALHRYLATLPNQSFNDGNCEPGAYYLVTLRAILARPFGEMQGNRAL
jgi:phospholipase C